jgi:DNA-binding FadR family transcriptional regulator
MVHDRRLGGNLEVGSGARRRSFALEDAQGERGSFEQRFGAYLDAMPDIGRKLRDLEQRGLVTKVSIDGRVLTTAGRKLLHRLEQERSLETSGDKFLKVLKRRGRMDIIDQLSACRVIESETAALAAVNATPQQVRALEESIAQGSDSVGCDTGIQVDTDFHDMIAQASGSNVLSALVIILRSQWLNQLSAAIRAKVDDHLVVDHAKVVNAIRARKPELARKAMEDHMNKLISDVDRYWE